MGAVCGVAAGAGCPTGSRWCVRGGPKVLATSYTILRAPNRACTVLLRRLLRPRAPCRCRSWPSCRAAVRASALRCLAVTLPGTVCSNPVPVPRRGRANPCHWRAHAATVTGRHVARCLCAAIHRPWCRTHHQSSDICRSSARLAIIAPAGNFEHTIS